MRHTLLIAWLLLLPLASQGATIKVYFAGGQSNATKKWAEAITAQLQRDDPSAVVVWKQHSGTPLREWYTGYSYSGNIGRQRYYLTDIHNPDPAAAGALEAAFHDLRARGDTPVLSGIFWFQGETDQYIPQSRRDDRYYHDILAFRDAIAEDFQVSHLPLALAVVYEGRGGPTSKNLQAIRDQQIALGERPDIRTYETIGLPRNDGVHLSESAAQRLGADMAK
ncbi:MAG TPA: sialate O-acetylesterase [Chthoniobacteraceae bacterium]|nr:sialate O-acetylesterase [Chthoniobacteraceae bacterium]